MAANKINQLHIIPCRETKIAIGEGFAETKEAWTDLLLDLKKRGLVSGPLLATGGGALGFWAAMQEAYLETTAQRCWVHYRFSEWGPLS